MQPLVFAVVTFLCFFSLCWCLLACSSEPARWKHVVDWYDCGACGGACRRTAHIGKSQSSAPSPSDIFRFFSLFSFFSFLCPMFVVRPTGNS